MIEVLLTLALGATTPAQVDSGATIPGATVHVYDVGAKLNRQPSLIPNQTPNVSLDVPAIDLSGAWETPFGEIDRRFCGRVESALRVMMPGETTFRLRADDGARLLIDGQLVAEDTEKGDSAADGSIDLSRGIHTLEIEFFQDDKEFALSLEWMVPGSDRFHPVPSDVLSTSAGQTHVTSPGRKRWYFDGTAGAGTPGDGRPLETVHPAYTLENFRPVGFKPAVGGMAFLPDGRLAVATWDKVGGVYVLDGLDPGEETTVTEFASGLGEPLGLLVKPDGVYVTQKTEVTRLRDTDGDGVADAYDTIAGGWPMSYNYHEFTFNLVDHDGALWVATSVPLKSGDTSYMPAVPRGSATSYAEGPGPGCLIRIDPVTGDWRVVARGLRTPNGLAVGPGGDLFGCDNQGDWLPSSRLNHYVEGGFYGHQETPDGSTPDTPPVAWFPQGEIGNSPSEPILIPDGHPFAGQMLVGDVTHGGIKRVSLQRVGETWQGTVFRFSQGFEAGVNRLVWGPGEGASRALYAGCIGSNGNWNHDGTKDGLQRIRLNGSALPFEVERVEAFEGGLRLTFTEPVRTDRLGDPDAYKVLQWRYEPTVRYGGPKVDEERLEVRSVLISNDRTQAWIELPEIRTGHVVHVRLQDVVTPAGATPWSTESWTTVNQLPRAPAMGFAPAPRVRVPDDRSRLERSRARVDEWVERRGRPRGRVVSVGYSRSRDRDDPVQVWRDAVRSQSLMMLESDAPRHAEVIFDGDDLDALRCPGSDRAPDCEVARRSIVVDRADSGLETRGQYGALRIHLEWRSSTGAIRRLASDARLVFQSQHVLQIVPMRQRDRIESDDQAAGILGVAPAMANASNGLDLWQAFDVWFTPAQFEGDDKVADARMSVYWNGQLVQDNVPVVGSSFEEMVEASGPASVQLLPATDGPRGEIRFRNIWVERPPTLLPFATDHTVRTVAGRVMAPIEPRVVRGVAEYYEVDPPLPVGLTLDPSTGAIEGRPELPSTTTHHVRAANAIGCSSMTLTLVVD